jgi:hypothetical protein
LHLLSQSCPEIIPVGVWKQAGVIHLVFGKPYQLEIEPGLSAHERDTLVGGTIMGHIAELLPERLRGEYLQEKANLQEGQIHQVKNEGIS